MNRRIERRRFDPPRNCATITMRQVLEGREPILLVAHDEDDHGWQFIGALDASREDGRVACLEEMVRLDPSVLEVADLPPGWQAIRHQRHGPAAGPMGPRRKDVESSCKVVHSGADG